MNTPEVNLPKLAQEWLDNYLAVTPEKEADQIRTKVSGLIPIIINELGLGDTSHAACLLTIPYNSGWLNSTQVIENFTSPLAKILDGLK
ncbi:MAG: hypothetical protein NTV01_04670 [Bacteroidia bacterium]|nr:hypothetical protein [Bacteroidia bacterium]